MNYAYIRVSTAEQNTDRQIVEIKNYCKINEKSIDLIFEEKVSGKDLNRPELQRMLSILNDGDEVYISELARLTRSTKDLLYLINEITKDKNCNIVSIKENLDANTSTGKMMLTMIGSINEFERDTIRERQAEGIIKAREKGVKFGRKPTPKPVNWDIVMTQYKNGNMKVDDVIGLLGIKRTLFYSLLKRQEGISGKSRINRIVKPDNFDKVVEKYILGVYTRLQAIELMQLSEYAFNKLIKVYKKEKIEMIERLEDLNEETKTPKN